MGRTGRNPARDGLTAWRTSANGSALVFDGEPWCSPRTSPGSRRAFKRAADAAGIDATTPYALRHSFASLLLPEGRSVVYVARQLGHDARLTLTRYGHVIDELDDQPRLPAEDAIRAAREALGSR